MIRLVIQLFFVLCVKPLLAQGDSTCAFHFSKIPSEGLLLDKCWRFHAGDNFIWSKADFDDSEWDNINPVQDINDLSQLKAPGIGWFRLHLQIDSPLLKQSLVFIIEQMGASEIYLNSHPIYTFGKVSSNQKEIKTYNPLSIPVSIQFSKEPFQVLAVRYAYKKDIPYFTFAGRPNPCFAVTINKTNQAIRDVARPSSFSSDLLKIGLFFILAILHFALFALYPKKSANLFFSLFAITGLLTYAVYINAMNTHDTEMRMYLLLSAIILFNLYNLLFLKALYVVLQYKKILVYHSLLACFLISIPLYFWPYHSGWILGFTILPNAALLESTRISLLAMKRKQKGAIIIAVGAISFLIFYLSFYVTQYLVPANYLTGSFYDWTYMIGVLSLPVATSIFLALEFAFTNRSLEVQLEEVRKLSIQTMAQEQEKQQILINQTQMLEQQVKDRTAELTQQKTGLEKALDDLKLTQTQLIQSEKDKVLAEHEKELHELEAKALRAQMNPHFIFNCINSIKSLIQKNEQDKAVNYLITFSKLIRTIFQNSDKREITLFDEIETCRLYSQLESLRFGNKLNYKFNVDETLDIKSIMVPALIIQPFIENAIWHGIMPKEEGGAVTVTVDKSDNIIRCVIDDDGIGREFSNQNKFNSEFSIHESKGVHLTQARIDLDNLLNEKKASINIIDKKNKNDQPTGTTVILSFEEYS